MPTESLSNRGDLEPLLTLRASDVNRPDVSLLVQSPPLPLPPAPGRVGQVGVEYLVYLLV